MGLSSSKTKTSSSTTPATFATPYINQALSNAQGVFQANQGTLQGLSASALAGYNSIAPAAYAPSAAVTNAQSAAGNIASGAHIGTNPGAATYQSLMAGQTNPASASLSSIANGDNTNPALSAYGALLSGGRNGAIPGLAAYGYGTGSLGAGDATLSGFASNGSNGASNAGDAYDQSVLGGAYLNGNPYVDNMADQATAAATKAANQRFGASGLGAGLSSAYESALGSAVADANNTLRYNAYNTERGYQEAASGRVSSNYNAGQDRSESAANALSAGSRADVATRLGALGQLSSADQARTQNALAAASGLGSTFNQGQQNQITAAQGLGALFNQDQATRLSAANAADSNYQTLLGQQLQALGQVSDLETAKYAGIAPSLSLLSAAAQTPYQGVSAYSGLVNGLTNGYVNQTGTTTQTGNIGQSLIGLGGSALAGWASGGFKGSDRRLKIDIIKLGELDDGLGVYRYRYRAGGPVRVGVMADEVEQFRPWALGPRIADVATVNYGAL